MKNGVLRGYYKIMFNLCMYPGKKSIWILLLNAFMLFNVFLITVTEFYYVYIIEPDIRLYSVILGSICYPLEAFCKWLSMAAQKDDIAGMRKQLDTCVAESANIDRVDITNENIKLKTMTEEVTKRSKRFSIMYCCYINYALLQWCWPAIWLLIYCKLNGMYYEYNNNFEFNITCTIYLPYKSYELVEPKTFFHYAFNFLQQTLGVYVSGAYILMYDCYYVSALMQITTQIKYLADAFETAFGDEDRDELLLTNNVMFRRCLIQHQRIIRLLLEFKRLFFYVMFYQISKSILVLCNIAFQASLMDPGDNPLLLVSYAVYCLTIIVQFFMFCWFGECVATELASITEKIYNSNWLMTSYGDKLSFQIALHTSQQEVRLQCGPFYGLDLITFKRVLTMSFSYYTVLQASVEGS